MAKLLLIEDDEFIAAEIKAWLCNERYTVDCCISGKDGLYRLQYFDYDLAIVDWLLPDMDGIQICNSIRESKPQIPLLMLTSRSNLADKIEGLDAGALDYLVKPCELEELSARIRALLRRSTSRSAKIMLFADLEVDPGARLAKCGEKPLKLSPSEFDVLVLLCDKLNEALDYKDIARSLDQSQDAGCAAA